MADRFAFVVEGLQTLADFEEMSADIRFKAVQTLNTVARDTRAGAAKRIREQVNFPSNYLNPAAKRLYVSKQARRNSLEAVVTARGRPTMLARFVTGSTALHQKGVTVEVGKGKTRFLKRAFLMRLPAGAGPVDTKSNLALAVRLGKGEKLENKKSVVMMKRGLYILYGPSVNQVFLSNDDKGVAADMTPEILDDMEAEFLRLMGL